MKLNSAQIEQTLQQLDAKAIPPEHPAVPQLEELFGDHTYFLDDNGLNIVEPVETDQSDRRVGLVVNLANWADENTATLQPHPPQPTERMVDFD